MQRRPAIACAVFLLGLPAIAAGASSSSRSHATGGGASSASNLAPPRPSRSAQNAEERPVAAGLPTPWALVLRYYDPAAGRFISRDPLGMWGDPGQNGNGQSYCGNNPVNGVDPLGLSDDGYKTVREETDAGPGTKVIREWRILRPGFGGRPDADPETPENDAKWSRGLKTTMYKDGAKVLQLDEVYHQGTNTSTERVTSFAGGEGEETPVELKVREWNGAPVWAPQGPGIPFGEVVEETTYEFDENGQLRLKSREWRRNGANARRWILRIHYDDCGNEIRREEEEWVNHGGSWEKVEPPPTPAGGE